MKKFSWTFGVLIAAGVATAVAQPPGGRGGPGGGRPPMPVIEALDADHDHVISAIELKNATSALLTLDKNQDGKLTGNEFGVAVGRSGGRPQGGPPNGGGRADGTGRRPQQEPSGGPGGREPGPGPDGNPPPPGPERMVEHAMEFDLDKDGKLSPAELKNFAEDFDRHHTGAGGPPGVRPNGRGGDEPGEGDRPRRPN